MSIAKAERFTALKAKVKAEMKRRNQSGSVADYGGTAYDYTVPPAAGKTIRAEHRDKLVGPMRAINSDLVPASKGTVIKEDELANMETRVAVWGARDMTDRSASDCKSGCTGTCYTGCAMGCFSCGGACSDGCTGCGSGCPTGCSGCGSGCPNGCQSCPSGCSDACSGCGDACSIGCTGCIMMCDNTCKNECGNSCQENCSPCTSACYSTCMVYCTSHGSSEP